MVDDTEAWEFQRNYERFRREANDIAQRMQGQDADTIFSALHAQAHRCRITSYVSESLLRHQAQWISNKEKTSF